MDKWSAIALAICIVAISSFLSVWVYSNNLSDIACYEARKAVPATRCSLKD